MAYDIKRAATHAKTLTNPLAILGAILDALQSKSRPYQAIAASTGDTILGTTGAAGDGLEEILVLPTLLSPGVITVKDGTTVVFQFPGGANSLSNLQPFTIRVGLASANGPWKIATGAGLSVVASGRFT